MKKIYCAIFGHKVEYAGVCPPTGIEYNFCIRCESMIEISR
jgi:hypothetical protein